MKKLSDMTDEERYGKVGAEIRRLDPEAYKNRKDKSAAANMKLLRELRAKAKAPATGRSTAFEESRDVTPARKETQADKDRRTPGSGAGFKNIAANLGDAATRTKYRAQGYGSEDRGRGESAAMRNIREAKESVAQSRMKNREESAAERRMKEGPRSFSDRMSDLVKRFGTARQRGETSAMRNIREARESGARGFKKGGSVKSSASRRADGIARKGKTRGRMV
jgi:hypothetical protein